MRCSAVQEVKRVLAHTKGAERVFFWQAAETGLRAGELIALHVSDVEKLAVEVRKNETAKKEHPLSRFKSTGNGCGGLQPSELFSPTVQDGTDSTRSIASKFSRHVYPTRSKTVKRKTLALPQLLTLLLLAPV